MRTILTPPAAIIAACLLVLLLSPRPTRAEATATTQPAAEGPEHGQRATTKPAKASKAKDEDEDAIPKRFIDAARKSFVVVDFYIKKDTSEPLSSDETDYRVNGLYSEYVDQKRPAEAPGLVLDDKGHVLINDPGLDDKYVDKITVISHGQELPAKRVRLLYDAPGVVLRVEPKAAGKLTPLKFSPIEDKGVNTVLYQSLLYRSEDQWRLRFGAARPSVPLAAKADSNVYFGGAARSLSSYGSHYEGLAGGLVLLADANGNPVGCATSPAFDLQQKECIWRGHDLISAKGIDWDKLAAAEKECRDKLLKSVYEIVIVMRQGDGDDSGMSRYSPMRSSSGAAGREISAYGIAVNDTDIVVLKSLSSAVARQIEKFYIKHSPTRRQEVKFVGAFKEIGGFVVRLPKGKLPSCAELAGDDPTRMKPFWSAKLRKRLGEKYVDLSTDRLEGKQRGYKGRFYWEPARPMPSGSFMVDFQGRIIGAFVHQKKENEEEQQLNQAGRWYGGRSEMDRVFTVSELRPIFTKPADHLDPKVEVTTKTLAKRRPWLGVEFVPITPKLAEMLKVETPTRDGQIGFFINAIYNLSPAEKLKLQVGDILLKIKGPAMPYPLELNGRFARDNDYYGSRWYYGGGDEEGEGPLEATWKNRKNFLTQALDAIGVGKTVRITYYHTTGEGKGETKTIDYKIELAPPDQNSAARWKNRKLGLTVKNLTYEVRYALGLKDITGVLVAKVESGSPTLIAKIYPNEIITRLDDKPITSVRQMRDMIAAAKKAGREKVRVTVLRLGKTRQADLSIEEYNPADDEGLDEE